MNRMLLLFTFLLSNICVAEPEIKGSPQELRGILYPVDNIVTIRGSAEETAYSDRAIISLVVTTEEEQLSDAITANHSLRTKLRQSLITTGIDQDKIKNSRFSSSPQFGWLGKRPNSYKVMNRVAITIEGEDQLQAVARLADQNKEVMIVNTAFEHSKERQTNKEVQSQALQNILQQKTDYEMVLGVKLIPVGIRKNNTYFRATGGAMAIEEVVVTGSRVQQDDLYSFEQEPSFDEILYEADLAVDFRIQSESRTQ
ncbi:SIMPL domain-containing protein [Microbulbifer sp. MLAF003]|uniref:SIMPL domain-containing protein n=1 Tax=Microbulbifer sp. MLAF003 TaxID=3032582 RepID=UPI0024AD1115|nr:SIMPL domain-containing protein [Microbulbifer sp. MLAF003]WHI52329.1 SIMPL domain-containing protein [Microbulbifer sp. MLAF003]